MDPSTPLDHALFHLTPTRTRCDLLAVPFGKGAAKEKIASGLLEPFLAHLRSARDQIPKGGYSFTLRPPREGNGDGRWFTKRTLERFVRFVATPEILERVVTIEKEIVQIEESIHRDQANASAHHTDRDAAATVASLAIVPVANGGSSTKPATPTNSNDDYDKHDVANEDNSKACLLRAFQTRKTILYKEQGMAYARASVAGFDKDTIDDLISFADAFGATRMKEACLNFLEVCKEKEKDKMWMDELAALEASRLSQLSYLGASGIMLTADNNGDNLTHPATSTADGHQGQNGSNEDPMSNPAANGASWNQGHFMAANHGNHGFPMGWPNHPQFPSYAYPGMPYMQPYPGYPNGSQWPARNDDERSQVRRKSGKVHRSSETALSSRDDSSDDNNSDPESGSDEKDISTDVDSSRKSRRNKKSHKKSSRMVVIRNINYISPKGRHEENDSSDKSSTNDVLDGDFLRRHVEDIVGSLEKHDTPTQHSKKKGEQRNAISNADLNDADDVDGHHEPATKMSNQGWDAFQNILLREEPDVTSEYGMGKSSDVVSPDANHLDGEYRKSTKPKTYSVDPILGAAKSNGFERNGNLDSFEHVENHRYVRRSQNTDEELLFSHRGNDEADPVSGGPYTEETLRLRGHSEGDWYAIAGSGRKGDISASRDSMFLEDNQVQHMKDQHVKKEKLGVAVDDSFIAPVRAAPVEKQPFSLWETDMSIISGVASGADNTRSPPTNCIDNNGNMEFHEPEELQLMLGRNLEVEQYTTSWTPEIDYSVSAAAHGDASNKSPPKEALSVDTKLSSNGKDAKTKLKPAARAAKPNISSKSFSKNKLEALSRPRTVSSLSKRGVAMSKAEKEEAERKRVEEQLLERQRRIAERSGAKPTTSLSRQSSDGVKPAVASPRQEKKTPSSKLQGSQLSKPDGLGHSMKLNRPAQVNG